MDNLSCVKAFIIEQIEKNPRLIAFNCVSLEAIDSSAIGFMVQFLNYAADNGIMLIFYDLNPFLQRLFDVARLSRYFKITTRSEFENRYVLNLKSRREELIPV
jgi:anti-anti-sigma factor